MTVKDYGRFGLDVINGAGLSSRLYQEMIRPFGVMSEAAKMSFGLGWKLGLDIGEGETMLVHSGSYAGCKTLILLFPVTRRGMVILTSSDQEWSCTPASSSSLWT